MDVPNRQTGSLVESPRAVVGFAVGLAFETCLKRPMTGHDGRPSDAPLGDNNGARSGRDDVLGGEHGGRGAGGPRGDKRGVRRSPPVV